MSAAEFHPLTPERWSDLERLFGERGACAGCWCMWWRLPRREWEESKGEANRRSFREIVHSGAVPGLLAFVDGEPVGWCAVEPRQRYPALARSRVLRPIDEQPVWSVTCFFIDRAHRGQGLATRLLEAAVEHVRSHGGHIVEGYPVEPRRDRMPDAFAWTGVPAVFEKAGFREVARGSETRPIMRRELE